MDESANYINGLFGLQGKVAIVSGSTGGLGHAMALALFQSGVKVVVNGRTEERAVAARDEMYLKTSRTSGLLALEGDMSVAEEAKDVVDRTIAAFGRLDIIVNNAGINVPEKTFEESSVDDWERLSAGNIKGPINLTKAALPYLKLSPAGRIINLSSIGGHVGLNHNVLYSMTKAAMLLFTQSLAAELASATGPTSRITVNSVSPGVFATPMNAKFEEGNTAREEILRHIPVGRLGQPEELVGVVLYLASSAASYTTGADFKVDGGYCAV